MSQKLQLKSELKLETAIQIARSLVRNGQVPGYRSESAFASKDWKRSKAKKKPVISRWRNGKGKKEDSYQ